MTTTVAPKLAARLARRIRLDIMDAGWPVGTIFGAEAELLERYDVSRAVFRETARLLEHLAVARMRRGPGGGLLVMEPAMTPVVEAVLVYLLYSDVSVHEVFEARIAIESTVAALAADRADERSLRLLEERVALDRDRAELDHEDHHQLHLIVARAADNPAAELFVEVLGRLSTRYTYPVATDRQRLQAIADSAGAHAAISSAIADRDAAAVRRRMERHLGSLAAWIEEAGDTPRARPWDLSPPADAKLGEQVAREIMRDVLDRGWPVGEVIASEADLLERFDASRAGVREAIRILEHHQVVRMRRGPGGGLVVTRPDLEAVVDAAQVFLDFRGIEARHLVELRVGLEGLAVRLLAARATEEDVAALHAVVDAEAEHGYDPLFGGGFHAEVAYRSGNRVVAMFTTVLEVLTNSHGVRPGAALSPKVRRSQVVAAAAAHRYVIAAIAAHDADAAERRLVRHLSALEPYLGIN